MASSQVNPNLRPRRRSIFGPVFLIVVGVVFLLINRGVITHKSAFIWFAEWWPALIILWGAIKLFEYWRAQKDGLPAPGIGGGGVVLLIFLTMFGLGVSGVYKASDQFNWSKLSDELQIDDEDISSWLGQKYDFAETIDKDFPAGGKLRIVDIRGDIKVTPSSDGKLHVQVKKTIHAGSQDDAKKISDKIIAKTNVMDKNVTFEIVRQGDWNGGRIDLEVLAPKNADLEITNERGAIEVRDREGALKINGNRGDVTVDGLTGNAELHMRGGDLNVRNLKGDVTLEGSAGSINVQDVSGALSIDGDQSDVQLSKIGKGVRYKSSRTDLEFTKLDGSMSMDIGDLHANAITGPFHVETRNKDIRLKDVTGDVRVKNSNGDVEVQPKTPFGNLEITNKSGSIRVAVPASGNYTVDARSIRGDIENDFNLSASDQNNEARASGVINKGGLRLTLNNEHGTIEIRKGELGSSHNDQTSMSDDAKKAKADAKASAADAKAAATDAARAAKDAKKKAQQQEKEF